MRLVIATPLYSPEIGGPATYTQLLEEGLPAHGIEVEVVKFSAVRHLPKILRHYMYYRRIRAALRGADAVLALDPVSVGFPAMLAAKREKKPFVVKIVGDYAWEQGTQRSGVIQTLDDFVKTKRVPFLVHVLRWIQVRVADTATRIIVPSEYLKGIIVAWGIQNEKIEVIYNAVSLGTLGQISSSVSTLSRPLIVTAGRLVPWKHIEGVIDMIAQLRKKGISASLAIVGDGPEKERLIMHAEKELEEGYIFTGTLSHADTLATIKSADVFVLNSSYEGLSHLLIEAQTLSVPIVATRVGGNSEVIADEENGLLVSAKDTLALANALSEVLSNKELSARFASHAKESAKRFSVDTMLTRVSDVLRMIV